MSLPKSAPPTFTSSRQLIPGDAVNGINNQLYSTQSLTASVVQTQAGATQVNAAAVLVTTNNANDAIVLPLGYPGLEIFIANPNNNTLRVFPSGVDTINGGVASAKVDQAATKCAIYKCIIGATATAGAQWYQNLSA